GNIFIGQTTSTSFTDQGLSKSTEYSYTVAAFNEAGPSAPSEMVYATTSSQGSLLAPYPPQSLTAELTVNARASNYIDGYVDVDWSSAYFESDPFELSYSGNPFSAMVFVVTGITFNDGSAISDGDVIGIYDGDLCVGKGTWPLPQNNLVASQDDGSGNGFSPGNAAYFKIWKDGFVRTVVESPSQVFNGLDVQSVDLTVYNDTYTLYRNGSELVPVLMETAYVDTMIESEMEYVYHVSATNVLGNAYESNPSGTAMVSTYEVEGNAPEITDIEDQTINEDNTLALTLSATDADNDEIIFFAHPLNSADPVACSVSGDQLTLTPAPDHFGEFAIEVIAFDDSQYYESNTLTDTTIFTLTVSSVNDAPVVLNPMTDLERVEGADSDIIDISNVFIDVDESVMDADELTLSVTADEGVETYITGETLIVEYTETQISGFLDISLEATDLSGATIVDTLSVDFTGFNEPPAFDWVPITEVIADSLYSEIVTATDPDNEPLLLEVSVLPEWLSFQDIGDNTAVLEGIPTSEDEGDHEVQMTVTDGYEHDTLSFVITVHPSDYLNVAPEWTSVPVTEASEDELYEYVMEASDENNDELTFSVVELPAWLSFDGTVTISGIPLQTDIGDHEISLNVSDGFAIVEQIFTVTVNAVNDAPVAMDDEYSTEEEDSLVIDAPGILANDVDVDDSTLTVLLIGDVSNGVLELAGDGSFIYTPDEGYSGTDQFFYSASDGELLSNTATVTITVTPVDDPPVAEDYDI
ncbi:MAG TPA: Ig-like domain-containing protein, partial [Candidatus Marinimicrobia bacterium]|nr:Ig-like domain-containing protein [Candidatus Neomarinimicrobiota bacterium]